MNPRRSTGVMEVVVEIRQVKVVQINAVTQEKVM
jgi:hypothetical protein